MMLIICLRILIVFFKSWCSSYFKPGCRVQDFEVLVESDLIVKPRNHDDSPLRNPFDHTSDVENMILVSLGVQSVSTSSTFFDIWLCALNHTLL